jgi:uncharacterized protein (UPF0548 family)
MAELRVFTRIDAGLQLERLRSRQLNFDPDSLTRLLEEPGWHVDHHRISLLSETPGEPSSRGPWATARNLCTTYKFVDPNILRAFYDSKELLEHRTMLLEVHFWGLRIYAGVRAGGSFDGCRTESGRRARVWGWNYRTLAGHFEQGQIDYEVWKWLDTGEVEFRINAVSRRANAEHPLINIGFLLFGRNRQIAFARTACERMAELTRAELSARSSHS